MIAGGQAKSHGIPLIREVIVIKAVAAVDRMIVHGTWTGTQQSALHRIPRSNGNVTFAECPCEKVDRQNATRLRRRSGV